MKINLKLLFQRFGWIIPFLWYPSRIFSDFIIDNLDWFRYEIEHSFAQELLIMNVFILIIDKITPKKILKVNIDNEKEEFIEEKNRFLKFDFLWWSIILNIVSNIFSITNFIRYINSNYTKSEFVSILILVSVFILIYPIRKKYLLFKKSKNKDNIQSEFSIIYKENQTKIKNRYTKNEFILKITSIISFISAALIALQGLIGISYAVLSLLLYRARMRAIENDELLEF